MKRAFPSLRHALGRKTKMYAQTGMQEYGVADVKGCKIIRMAGAGTGGYARRDEFAFGAPCRAPRSKA